jgi:predicted MPP superfamily phosphohydrolase
MPDLAKILSFGVLVAGWFLVHVYLYRRLNATFGLTKRARVVLAFCLIYFSTAYVIGRAAGRAADSVAAQGIVMSGAVWMGFLGIFLMSLIPADFLIYGPLWIGWKRRMVTRGIVKAASGVCLGLALVVSVVLSSVGLSNAYGPIGVTRLDVVMPGLPASMDSYRIVFLSDIHVGGLVRTEEVARIENVVKSCGADLIILGGDLTDEERGGDGSVFRRFASWAPPGQVVAVSGNHERYVGGVEVLKLLSSSGVRVLRQESIKVGDGLWIAGVDDPAFFGRGTGIRGPIELALAKVPDAEPVILVSHQPVGVEDAAAARVSLMLSGHTHHGQMPPSTFLTPLIYRYFAGRYDVGGMVLYVTSGAAFWGPPLRIGTHPEVAQIVLNSPYKSSQQHN